LSFRTRLTLFFVLIVVLPMVALAVLVVNVAEDSRSGKADAALSADLDVGATDYRDALTASERAARKVAASLSANPRATDALQNGDGDALAAAVRESAKTAGAASVVVETQEGKVLAREGNGRGIATASVDLLAPTSDGPLASVTVASTTASRYLAELSKATGEDAALVGPRGPISGTVPIEATSFPEGGEGADVEVRGEQLRVATRELRGGELRLAVFIESEDEPLFGSSPVVAAALIGFFLLALLAIAVLTRTLQGQIKAMLAAAQRLGGGDFSEDVPVVGRDEMAGLASEFNKMSERLATQMDELRRQRKEIGRSVERIGAAFASGLDRHKMLEILVETAVAACQADYGLVVLSGHVGAEVETGAPTEELREASLAAEARAAREDGVIETEHEGAYALASSLGQISSAGPVGVMTIARAGRRFSNEEQRVFVYLLGQAETSVENAALHELVSEQAVTDELTGLANNRAFREAMDKEAARAVRFRHNLALAILDIDNFKKVNDTYGHLQGDAVLRAIGNIMRAESRGIDFPARYGGEEFVVALPETDAQGAVEVAERIRERIEAERVPFVEGDGELAVTASIGVATMGDGPSDVQALLAAADEALYEAKGTGKNRVVLAPVNGAQATIGTAGRDGVGGGEDGTRPPRE
jgi:diguanylate cyclase (GGDEF)-like protein